MTGESNLIRLLTVWIMTIFILTGCSKGSGSNENPVVPSSKEAKRQAMDFFDSQPLFGEGDIVAADVDLASVVWGQVSAGTGSGDVVVFPDETSWVVAVAIQDDPDNENVPSQPWLRFLNQENEAQDGEFAVNNLFSIPPRKCRLPKVDCTYIGFGILQVVVAFRYGVDECDCDGIETWDIKVTKINFRYTNNVGWEQIEEWQYPMSGAGMADNGVGETHPDICYDHATGDIYLAWTEIECDDDTPVSVDAQYARHDHTEGNYVWHGPYSLMNTSWDGYSPWYVSLDVGDVVFAG